jgi:DNA-binding winged helix-turn-helix (wHTH) protein
MVERPVEAYAFGDFRLDVGEHRLERRTGAPIVLADKAFQTLVHLVRRAGALVTREEILSTVWPGVFIEDGNVAKTIHTIRRALGDGAAKPAYIETVSKYGYRFVATVTVHAANSRVVPAAESGRSAAYDLYIRGKVKAGSENPHEADEAIALLEAAVARDPTYAAAYAQLARAYNTRAFKFTSVAEGGRLRENAEVALAKAMDLDPQFAEAHFARGLVLWTKAKNFPHEQAIAAFRRALELDPHHDEAHHQLSMVYSHVGLLDEALEHVRRAIDLNPNNTMARFRVAVYTAWQCRFDAALRVLKTVPSEVSRFLVERVKAEVCVQAGRSEHARAIVENYLAAHPSDEGGSLTSVRALLLAKDGRRHEAERAIADAVALGEGFGHFHHTAYNIAAAYAAFDAANEAIAWLEAAADDGFPCYPYFMKDPNLESLRGRPRFTEFMAALHAQWSGFKGLVWPARGV